MNWMQQIGSFYKWFTPKWLIMGIGKHVFFYFANNWQSHTLPFVYYFYWKCMRCDKNGDLLQKGTIIHRWTWLNLPCWICTVADVSVGIVFRLREKSSKCSDPICILMHVSNFNFAPCVRTLVSAIALTVRALCCRLWYFKTLAFAFTFNESVEVVRKKKETPHIPKRHFCDWTYQFWWRLYVLFQL